MEDAKDTTSLRTLDGQFSSVQFARGASPRHGLARASLPARLSTLLKQGLDRGERSFDDERWQEFDCSNHSRV